jgi:serine/threonine protein kinase
MPVDAANSAGLALSSLSLMGQLIGGSIRVFESYHKAEGLSNDALQLQIILGWARGRLETWATEWGVEEGLHLKSERFRKFGWMAMNHLVYINYELEELSSMDSENSTIGDAARFTTAPTVSLARLSKDGGVPDIEIEALRDKIKQLEFDAGSREKVRWVLENKGALKKVQTINQMIEQLFLQFPPPCEDPVAAVARNQDLRSSDENKLGLIGNGGNFDPLLASLTILKVEQLRLERRAENLRSTEPDGGASCLINENGKGLRRKGVWFNKGRSKYPTPVLVEVKEIVNNKTLDRQNERIRNIARLLAMDQKPAEMRTLHCLGVVSLEGTGLTRHKLVYKLPAPEYFTLNEVLSVSRKTLPLGKKFACARILARAVVYLHLAGWLHKGIRSDNIILCADSHDQVDLAEPYVCGFEYSRQAISTHDTEDVDGDRQNNLYRHPDAQGLPQFRREYKAAYDVYALGMVLLELGHPRWSLKELEEKFHVKTRKVWSAMEFKKWLLQKELPKLIPIMGEIYVRAIKNCLEGLHAAEGCSLEETLFIKVVKEVNRCQA